MALDPNFSAKANFSSLVLREFLLELKLTDELVIVDSLVRGRGDGPGVDDVLVLLLGGLGRLDLRFCTHPDLSVCHMELRKVFSDVGSLLLFPFLVPHVSKVSLRMLQSVEWLMVKGTFFDIFVDKKLR